MAQSGQELHGNQDYDQLVCIQRSLGETLLRIGKLGRCRFCGETSPRKFKTVAHALPEALGNKWIVSLDECDRCNARFGTFDDALVKSIGAVLTVGGTPGKNNKVRQTGRTAGPASIKHKETEGRRGISVRVNEAPASDHFGINVETGELILRAPSGSERFVPSRAYKAVVKMAVSFLPPDELSNFAKIIDWLLNSADYDFLPHMLLGLSFANVGNAPPLVSATLLKRRPGRESETPYMLFVATIGSICLQVVLKSDDKDGPWPSRMQTRPNMHWTNVIGAPGMDSIRLSYEPVVHVDCARADLELPIVEAIVTAFEPRSANGRMLAQIRESALAPGRE